MDNKKRFAIVILLIGFLLLLDGCKAAAAPTPLPEQPFEIIMDGKECAYSGPTELPAGEYEILINNTSEISTDIHITRILDGHTYQEVLEMQPEPGVYFDIDFSWFEDSMKNLAGWDDNDNYIYRFSLTKEGEYAIVFAPAEGLWLCGSIMVNAAPAE